MGMPTLEDIGDTAFGLKNKGYKSVKPHFIPKILVNMAAGNISIKYGLKVRKQQHIVFIRINTMNFRMIRTFVFVCHIKQSSVLFY